MLKGFERTSLGLCALCGILPIINYLEVLGARKIVWLRGTHMSVKDCINNLLFVCKLKDGI